MILAMIILGVMVFSAAYVLSFTLTGSKITGSYELSTKAYYLAEAGLSEAVFKLKNDSTWKNAFETLPTPENPTCSSWSISPLQRTGGVLSNGSYTVTINNLGCARAEIVSRAEIQLPSGVISRRVVRCDAFKAIGSGSGVENIAMFSAEGAGLTLRNSANVNITGGNVFTGGAIDAQNSAKLSSNKGIEARSQINTKNSASITANASTTISAADCNGSISPWPCNETPPESITMPAIDFDSSSSTSYKNQADYVYTEQEFKNLLGGSSYSLTVPVGGGFGIVYVTGNVTISNSRQVTVNGLLVVDGNITLENSSQTTVNNAGDSAPAGLLAKGKIETKNSAALDANGLVYALNAIDFNNSGHINLNGGIMSGTGITFENSAIVNITYNQQAVNTVLSSAGATGSSPMITLEHWEEEY